MITNGMSVPKYSRGLFSFFFFLATNQASKPQTHEVGGDIDIFTTQLLIPQQERADVRRMY